MEKSSPNLGTSLRYTNHFGALTLCVAETVVAKSFLYPRAMFLKQSYHLTFDVAETIVAKSSSDP